MEKERHFTDNRLSEHAESVGNDSVLACAIESNSIPEENSKNGETIQELSGSLHDEIFVYRQDVIGCKNHENKLGVVMEVAGDMDSEGSLTDESESEDDEDRGRNNNAAADGDSGKNNGNFDGDEKNDSLSDGQVRVVWNDGFETTENITDITVVDRGFLHGDIVASASDPTGQLGLVLDVSITVDLQAANGELIKGLSSRVLKCIREFNVGDYVVCGPWLGRVDDVLDNVTVMFDDGSVCKVVKADPLRLKPVSRAVIDDASCPYYPGQRVRAVSSSVFRSSRWLSGLWKSNRLEGTIIKVQPASVIVHWIASAYIDVGTNSSSVPAEEQNPKGLTLLSCFSYANWQLGDWCLLPSPHSVGGSTANDSKEPDKGCVTHCAYPDKCSVDKCIDNSRNTCTEALEQVSYDPNFASKEHHTSDILIPEEGMQEDTISSSHMIRSDAYCPQTIHDGNSLTPTNLNSSQISDSVKLDRTDKSGEINVSKSGSGLSESGSCSSSVPKDSSHESWPAYRKKLRKVFFKREKKARKKDDDYEKALCVVNTMTKVDVAWQDGTREFGLDSKSLIPIHTPNDHEFFPEQYVVEKVTNETDESSETKRIGVVRSVNSKERTVCVRWLKPVSRPEDPREFDCDEIVSAYELDEHPDYDYCYGDVVVRLSPVSTSADTADYCTPMDGHVEQSNPSEAEGDACSDHSGYDETKQKFNDESCENFTSLSWVGNITGLHDGDIEVTWADGMVSKVGPQAVYVVGREDDGESFDGGSEASDDAASWETVDEDRVDEVSNTEKEVDSQSSANNIAEGEKGTLISEQENNVQNGPLSMSRAAISFVTRLATGLFSRSSSQLDESASSQALVTETTSQESLKFQDNEVANNEAGGNESDDEDTYSAKDKHEITTESNHVLVTDDAGVKTEEHSDNRARPESDSFVMGSHDKDGTCSFKHFDIAENPMDHYFLGGSEQSTGGRKWVKKVQQEWSILEKNLPDAIYVRVFEDRMDLLRAVIIGASGTPYQDGLFFFDFQLPPEYPQVPPSAYYHSGGLRINPNLYVEGKVCLSLLNTWTGKGNEVWDPSSSSILQVLVSLQGLVLNSKPYFNEAGYEKQVGTMEGEKNSLPYNENTYLLNLKSMMYLLRRQPMHFEGFVKEHFRRRGQYILKACEAYMTGCLIGSLTKDACMTEKSKELSCSVGFKLMLAKILPRLMSALSEVGVDCQPYAHLLKA